MAGLGTETAQVTITEFLLARIAEDEDDGRGRYPCGECGTDLPRVLAECEAKRGIVNLHTDSGDRGVLTFDEGEWHACSECGDGVYDSYPCETLIFLARVYFEHPDYQQWERILP